MLSLRCYELRLAEVERQHPEMPADAVTMVRFVIFLQRQIEDHLIRTLEQFGLSHSSWSLLIMIYSDPDRAINPSNASDALRQSRPHMTRMTDELVARGWVSRSPDETDRRAVVLRLTAAGEAALRDILPVMWRTYEALIAGFSADESAQLGGLLRRWLLNLESAPPPGAPSSAPAKDTP